MIEVLKVAKEELKRVSYKIHGLNVAARLEVSPQKKPLTKTHALFFKGLTEVKGDVSWKKTGLSTPRWCPRFVQSSMTPFLKQW